MRDLIGTGAVIVYTTGLYDVLSTSHMMPVVAYMQIVSLLEKVLLE